MNEAIETFIAETFTNEFIDLVHKAFSLFEAYDHQNAYAKLVAAVMDESISTTESRADFFSKELKRQLDYIIIQHRIELTGEATISDRILILDALFRIQHLENYVAYESIVESEEDSIDQMARILEELTNRDQGYFLGILERVDDSTIKLLKIFIQGKTSVPDVDPIPEEIIKRIRLFNQTFGTTNIAHVLIDAGMRPGYSFDLYIPFIQDYIVDDQSQEQTAINYMSVMNISNVPEHDFLMTFRNSAESVFKDPEQLGKLETHILTLIAKLDEARKVQNEKDRLSETSTSVGTG